MYETKKSIYGILKKNNKQYFYKKIKSSFENEVNGYNLVSKYYHVPKRIDIKNNEIIYQYKKELINKTLHEFIYKYNYKVFNYYKVIKQIKKNYSKKIMLKESNCQNIIFFKERTYLLEKYKNDTAFQKEYLSNGKKYNIIKILNEIIETLNCDKTLTSYITIGDPTDTNISVNGLFTDFETAGYNSVIGEIAILFASFLTHGCYFYPKYNKESYLIRPYILNHFKEYEPAIINNTIRFNFHKKSGNVIKDILKIYQDLDIKEQEQYMKAYICTRILTPLDVTKMNKKDKKYIIYYLIYIYHNITCLDDIINLIGEYHD